jgi:2-polyprenyl-3-methyl-5-hydroxy-6-metoxy-1,4-benzoquinol methylase
MPVAILFPRYDHPAIEERYATWQSETLLRRAAAELHHYDFDESARHALVDVDSPHVLVITDPLLLASPRLPDRLAAILDGSNAFAALPSSTQSAVPAQRTTLPPYMTLREFEIETTTLQQVDAGVERLTWDLSDPGAFLCRTADIRDLRMTFIEVLKGRDVVISRSDFIHRWASLRGDGRQDLLERIAPDAKSVLEFGCGEGALGAALKQRQKVRVVGIELDHRAAALAKKRLDDVYQGDALEIVSILHEQFDWIVGGDIVEHLAEPWTFLSDLRRLAKDDGRLLLSIPNLSNASIIADLLHGRFDYVYMGLTCAGHLRFFTRRSIEEMLSIAGWDIDRIDPQELTATHERDALIATLEKAAIPFSKDDLLPTGYYVTARKRR